MKAKIKLNDLESYNHKFKDEYFLKLSRIIDNSNFILGDEVSKFEENLRNYTKSKYVLGVSNGTDALKISLMALGINAGDEVILPAFTFIATSEVISLLGAKPVFCDIKMDDFNIDDTKIRELISTKTKAIIAVSLFGQCPNFKALKEISKEYSIPLIEDAAQSLGATYFDSNSCNIADISTTSFFPAKPLGCFGDGGAIFTNNEELFLLMKKISRHGQESKYYHTHIGINGRLDTVQAAILNLKIGDFNRYIEIRNSISNKYYNEFSKYDHNFKFQKINNGCKSTFAQFTIICSDREDSIKKLEKNNIPYAIHYPLSLNEQPVYKGFHPVMPVAENVSKKILSLPFHAFLKDDEIEYIVSSLNEM